MNLLKPIYLLRARKHFWNRLKLRNGKAFYFFFAKVIDKKPVCDERKDECLVWKFKKHLYITQNNQLQTYIKK